MRHIVSGIGSLNQRGCEWLDCLQQPLVQRIPGYLQDTRDVLRSFHNTVQRHCYTWLHYSLILYSGAIASLEFHLDKYRPYSDDFKEYMKQVAIYLMAHNYFSFNKGMSMGEKYSPSLANLVML